MKMSPLSAIWMVLLLAVPGFVAAADPESPLQHGGYASLMYSHVEPDNDRGVDAGQGGTLSFGYRLSEGFALELYGVYGKLDGKASGSESATMSGGGVGAMAFLGDRLPGVYLPFAVGYLQTDHQAPDGNRYKGLSFEAGLGYLFPVALGRYDFAIRAEGRYRHNDGESGRDLDEKASGLDDVLLNLGVQLPMGLRPVPVAAPVEPVAVVPVQAPADSDGDGVTDDRDQCPNTPAGTAVNEVGCPLPPPCKPPEAGQKVDLSGCAVGDSIVLRGVNFEYDQATLTVNAQTLLDGVADALKAVPDVAIEVDGHTDSRGDDAYNRNLSERRAQSVMQYLGEHGVDASRMSAVGYGETEPIADNDSDEGRELNRRVELKIVGVGTSADAGQGVDDASISADAAPAFDGAGDESVIPDGEDPSPALEPAAADGDDPGTELQPGQ
jgi:outer membrane protein OmpA-like peptidoglycan-associated protein